MTRNFFLPFGAVAVLFFAHQAPPARAYEEDTHFTLTFVECRIAGFTEAEALTVAGYDQGMDDSPLTVANSGAVPNPLEEHLWHALPYNGTTAEVLLRKGDLWQQVLDEKDGASQLKRLGVFLHYQQDSWSHRKHPNSDANVFTTYSVPVGHAMDGHQPDRPPFDPVCALRCLEDGLRYARYFVKEGLHRTPNPLLDGYEPAKGEIDEAWTDDRKDKFFHQLAADESNEAHALLTDLIRAQVGAYTSTTDTARNYIGHKTADELPLAAGAAAFQAVLDRRGLDVKVPASRTPITSLTSFQLTPGNMGTQDYTVRVYTGDKFGAGTDSDIFLSLKSAAGQITEQKLNRLIKGNAFERDHTDSLTLSGLAAIGEITSIRVRSDAFAPGSAWYLGWIEIGGPGLTTRRFTLNDWIEVGKLTRTLEAK